MRTTLDLNGHWELAGFKEEHGNWDQIDQPFPIQATVPGEVHPALEEAGILGDLYQAMNFKEVEWVEDREWWYRRHFMLPSNFGLSKNYLEFDGLDTFASVFLNGEEIGSSKNMFTPYRFDVTGKLRTDRKNVVEVRFSPVTKVIERMGIRYDDYYIRYNPIRIGARKMQASFGWDWMPKFLGAGIWGNARLTSCDRLVIRDVLIKSVVKENEADLSFEVEIENTLSHSLDAELTISISLGEMHQIIKKRELIPTSGTTLVVNMTLSEPKLWWPNGLGEQPLYQAEINLRSGNDLLDTRWQRFALRTVELCECNDLNEPAFFFKINGTPVFMKGANWIPADSFPSRVSSEKYRHLLSLAGDAHINLLRVWGGGIYEKDEFYDLCDELGLMIWQDFMFSLAEYPEDDDFANNVSHEAHAVVRRLRNHPSIVLWCGNNECEMDTQADAVWSGKRLFHEIIPRTISELDRTRPYWPSSPYGGPIAHSSEYGDYHGEPWFHVSQEGIETYRKWLHQDKGLFMSEFPTQGSPELESLTRFIPQEKLFPIEGEIWDVHAMNNKQRQEKIGLTSREALLKNIRMMIGDPLSIEQFAYQAGVLQGVFLQSQIEYYRRHKYRVGGCLFWDFDDAWPAVGYSIVDYYGRPKPAYYFVKRAFSPVILSFEPGDGGVRAFIINDRHEPVSGYATISLLRLRNGAVQQQQISFNLSSDSVSEIWAQNWLSDPQNECLIGTIEIDGQVIYQTSYFGVLLRDVSFPVPSVSLENDYHHDTLNFRIVSSTFAHAVKLTGLPDNARPDDNYFDLLPREPRIVTIRNITESEAELVGVLCCEMGSAQLVST